MPILRGPPTKSEILNLLYARVNFSINTFPGLKFPPDQSTNPIDILPSLRFTPGSKHKSDKYTSLFQMSPPSQSTNPINILPSLNVTPRPFGFKNEN